MKSTGYRNTRNRTVPSSQAPEGLASRRAALKVIRDVTEKGAYASLSLDSELRGAGLNASDRHLASRLVYDTLDRLPYLDMALNQLMAREDTDIRLRNILRLGACQILLEDRIPESAATNTCVYLCSELGMEGLKGVCNGILRNLIRKKDQLVFPDPETEPDEAAVIRFGIPKWLWMRLREDWGQETAEKIAGYRGTDTGITIRPNLTRISDVEFETLLNKKVWGHQRLDIPHAWRITGAMDIGEDADFRSGQFSIQSESSMLAVMAMDPARGRQYLDCCAAPGGKTCYMSELMNGTGRILAWDVHPHRISLIDAQRKRLGLENIRPVVRDALSFRSDLEKTMDGVLLDAPCTGTGMMSEKPDIKLHCDESSLTQLSAIQARLLDSVCMYVKEGGTLVYSTCSVLKSENEDQISSFLSRHPEFYIADLPDSVPEKYRVNYRIGVQLFPFRDNVEGFYICRMKRKSMI